MCLNRRRPFGLPYALLGLAAVVLLVGCRGRSRAPAETAAPPEIAQVEIRDLDVRAEAAGTIQPLKVIEVKSRVAGELQRLMADTNQLVKEGALLAEIDPRDVNNAFEQATADREVAKARVETTSAQARRAVELFVQGVIPAQDRENADLAATNARADLLKAETNLSLAQQRLGDVKIRAPISGTIIERTVEQGQIVTSASANVSGGTTLVKMANLSVMQARALVDEVDIGRIRPGQTVGVTVEAYPGRVFRGEVEKIEPLAVVDQNITMFPVLVRLANPEGLLKPGMNAEVAIAITERRGVTAVPNSAVVAVKDLVSVGTMLGLDAAALRGKLGPPQDGAGRETAPPRPPSAGAPASAGEETGRSGFVFIRGAAGPEARAVRLGVSDWDFTEVITGVSKGDPVYLISVARMQQQQQRFNDRMRQSTGFGASGGGRPGGPR